MSYNLNNIEKILTNVGHSLQCMDLIDPSQPPQEVKRIQQSNKCLEWVYTNHLKDKYTSTEIDAILALFKVVLIPRLQSLQDPDSMSYTELLTILKGAINKFRKWKGNLPRP